MPSTPAGSSSLSSHKLDKLNLLLYSSSMAFLLMVPIWVYYDLPLIISGVAQVTPPKGGESAHSVAYYFFMNGTVHYAQNIIAFVILASTSPVTYSIASLIKRVAVICIAIVWFSQNVHPIQALGIAMTFTGLYMYNNAKGDVEKGEKKLRRMEATRELMLPTTKEDVKILSGTETPPEEISDQTTEPSAMGSGTIYGRPREVSLSAALGHQIYSQQHHHRPAAAHSLHIKTTNSLPQEPEIMASSVDLYPSPPLSTDSPPSDTIPLPTTGRVVIMAQ